MSKTKHVYIVLEHYDGDTDEQARIHGVYSDRYSAIRKALKIDRSRPYGGGYMCILKKTILGPKV